ncbi:hypothetical protein EMIT0P44_40122 [Pseudomonas sp. IT-P44]
MHSIGASSCPYLGSIYVAMALVRHSCRSQLAGDGFREIAIASKLAPTDRGHSPKHRAHHNPVGASLPAMAPIKSPSPASRLLRIGDTVQNIGLTTIL